MTRLPFNASMQSIREISYTLSPWSQLPVRRVDGNDDDDDDDDDDPEL